MKLSKIVLVARSISILLWVILALFLNWLFLPAWNIHSEGFWRYIIALLIIGTAVSIIVDFMICHSIHSLSKVLVFLTILVILMAIIFIITSLNFAEKKRFYINYNYEIDDVDYQSMYADSGIPSISGINDLQKLDFLDSSLIQNLQKEVLQDYHFSQYDVDTNYNLINYKNSSYRVSPLTFSNFMDAFKEDCIPGYMLINSKTHSGKIVEKPIIYAPSAIFSHDLKRHLRNQYPTYIFYDDFQFDIDDSGNAYYIAQVMKSTKGMFGAKVIKSFVLVDCYSGKCEEYLPDDLPSWVDHACSLNYITDTCKDFLSSAFSLYNNDKFENKTWKVYAEYNAMITDSGVQFFIYAFSNSSLHIFIADTGTGTIKYFSTSYYQEPMLIGSIKFDFIVDVCGELTYIISSINSDNSTSYSFMNLYDQKIYTKSTSLEYAFLKYLDMINKETI